MLQNGSFTRTNGAASDPTVYPRFFLDQVQDNLASEREGRPIFRDEERVEIIMAGNPYSKPVHKVNDEHRQRWPKEYEAFKQGQELAPDGTPLEEWPRLKRSQVLELKAIGFMTVEQIAAMSDQAIQRIPMYGRQLKELAAAFIDDAQRNALAEKLSAENERKDAEISTLRAQVQELGTMLNDLHGQVRAMQNAPHPIAAAIPGMSDPSEQLRQAQGQHQAPAASSLSNLTPSRRRRSGAADPGLALQPAGG